MEWKAPEEMDVAVLTLFMDRHPAPVHADDLALAFAGEDWPAAVSALETDGVLHREGALHLLSRPALRVAEMLRSEVVSER